MKASLLPGAALAALLAFPLHAQEVRNELYTVVDGVRVDGNTLSGFKTWRSAACDRCHGANQEGMVGPSLVNSLKVLTKGGTPFVNEGRNGARNRAVMIRDFDGNTVEMNIEQAQYGKAAAEYQATLSFFQNSVSGLRKALRGD